MRRGEVRWYRFRAPDKKRPVLVLTRNSALDFLDEVTIAPITSTVREIPTEVVLGVEDGMTQECAVNLDHLQTVPRRRLGALITLLPDSALEEVRQALLFALGFD
jgi:mRNA interferase MazF